MTKHLRFFMLTLLTIVCTVGGVFPRNGNLNIHNRM